MHPKPIDILNFRNCSLFTTEEYKIDSGNLHISKLSPGRSDKEIIPLELIDSKPRVSKKKNEQLIWASIISFMIGMLFIFIAISQKIPEQQIVGLVFVGISALFLIASLKLQTTSYTYFYANTTTQLFTIQESPSDGTDTAQKFVESLNKRINKPQRELNRKNKDDNYSEFLSHLDYLYNFGVITDNQYKIIQDKINTKLFGNTEPRKVKSSKTRKGQTGQTAKIIPLPVRDKII